MCPHDYHQHPIMDQLDQLEVLLVDRLQVEYVMLWTKGTGRGGQVEVVLGGSEREGKAEVWKSRDSRHYDWFRGMYDGEKEG